MIAKEDVILRASVRTLSGALVRPHGDWDSRKIHIYGELMIGERVLERLQLFYNNDLSQLRSTVLRSPSERCTDGITLRVVAADPPAETLCGESELSRAQRTVASKNHDDRSGKAMNLLAMVSVTILCWGPFSAPHQHKTSINSGDRTITQYLEQLDSQERDRSQKPAEVLRHSL